MGFENLNLFLNTNISDVSPIHELGNYLLIPGLFLWGGKNVTILNTKQLTVVDILSLKERNWKSPLVWLQTALAIIVVIPSTILGACCKGLSIYLSTNLRQNYHWVALNILQKTKEQVEDYSILDPSFFNTELTDKTAFEQRTVNKPFLKSILIFLLSEENLKSWDLVKERQKIAAELDINEFKKALNFFVDDYGPLERLFNLLPAEKIFDLGKDPDWKPWLLFSIPNDEETITNFIKCCLKTEDVIEIFQYRGFSFNYRKNKTITNLDSPLRSKTTYMYGQHLFLHLIKAISRKKEQINFAYFLARFQIITPTDFFPIIHRDVPWVLGYAFYPLQAYLVSESIASIERWSPILENTNFRLSEERARSNFSFSKFAKWMKECDQSKDLDEQKRWLAEQELEEDPSNLLSYMHQSVVYYFIFLRKLFEYDLKNGCRVINRYLKEEDRKLVSQVFPESPMIPPSLYESALHQVHRANLNRETLNKDILFDLEELDWMDEKPVYRYQRN